MRAVKGLGGNLVVGKPSEPCQHRLFTPETGTCETCSTHYVGIIRTLQRAVATLERRLAERRDVEKAKARLMHHEGLTEAAAFVQIRTRAMAERRTMGAVAFDILVTTAEIK